MATELNPEGCPKANQDEDMMCTVCLELKKDPRLLPCLHSYCTACLQKMLSKTNTGKKTQVPESLNCPQCRTDHVLSRAGVEGFPKDQVLANAIEVHVTKAPGQLISPGAVSQRHQCTMCTEDDPATCFCTTCGKYLCDFCQKAHKRLVDFRTHTLTALNQMDQVGTMVAVGQALHCTLHAGEVLKLYCKTCQKVICRDCTIVDHRNHDYGFINELRPQIQQGVKTTIARLQVKQQEFNAHLSFLKEMEKSREAHSLSLENELGSVFNSYIEALKVRCAELLSVVQTSKDADMKQIWAQKQHVETTLANLSSAVRYAERLCGCPSDMVMLTMQSEAIGRFNSLQSTEWNATDMDVSVPHTFSATDLQLSTAGKLDPDSVRVSLRSVESSSSKQHKAAHVSQHHSHQVVRSQPPPPPTRVGESTHIYTKVGESVELVFEVSSSKTSSQILPSVSITSQLSTNTQHPITYTTKYHDSGVWSLVFTPPYSGTFTVTLSVSNHLSEADVQKKVRHQRSVHQMPIASPGAWQVVLSPGYFQRPPPPPPSSGISFASASATPSRGTSAAHTIHVSGVLKIGDVVRRGPHWSKGEEDGGKGGLGSVTSIKKKQPKSHYRSVAVKWESGRDGEYEWNESQRRFEVELAPPVDLGLYAALSSEQ